MDAQSEQEKLEALQFQIKQTNFCLELKYIEKVILLPALEVIPNSPHFVAGLLNIHGKPLPVIDLALRLGFRREKRYSIETPVILCHAEEKSLGMIVDHIVGLIEITKEKVEMQDQFQTETSFVLASLKIEKALALLLNINIVAKFPLVMTPFIKENSL